VQSYFGIAIRKMISGNSRHDMGQLSISVYARNILTQ